MGKNLILRLTPRNILYVFIIFLIIFSLSLFIFYKVGIKDGFYYRDLSKDLAKQLNTMQLNLDELREKKILAENSSEIANLSLESARSTILFLKQEINDLETDIALYRSLIGSEKSPSRILVHEFDVFFDESTNFYKYSAVITQVPSGQNILKGSLDIFIEYIIDSKVISTPINSLSEDKSVLPIPLKFNFFQKISGKFKLPENINPTGILLKVQSSGKITNKKFPWRPLLRS
tara:strand:+ start:2254 stop:2952 length:699 start_codon:yes stop_codon:yes gene_type:complete